MLLLSLTLIFTISSVGVASTAQAQTDGYLNSAYINQLIANSEKYLSAKDKAKIAEVRRRNNKCLMKVATSTLVSAGLGGGASGAARGFIAGISACAI